MRFSLKPVFIGWTTLLAQFPLQILLTVWCAGFSALGFGLVSTSGVMVRDVKNPDAGYQRIRATIRLGA